MQKAVAQAILRLWKATKSSTGADKLTRMKKIKKLTASHGGVSVGIRKAKDRLKKKMILRNDPARQRRLKTKGEYNQAQKHRR
tara:strand:+ start:1835 stop:2083 length:249 start_codon:yes stop_codon:yes gene_type:complete